MGAWATFFVLVTGNPALRIRSPTIQAPLFHKPEPEPEPEPRSQVVSAAPQQDVVRPEAPEKRTVQNEIAALMGSPPGLHVSRAQQLQRQKHCRCDGSIRLALVPMPLANVTEATQ